MGERQVTIAGMLGVSLAEYIVCLAVLLETESGAASSVRMMHRSALGELLHDLQDTSQPRFSELVHEAAASHSQIQMEAVSAIGVPFTNEHLRSMLDRDRCLQVHCERLRVNVYIAGEVALIAVLPGLDGSTIHCVAFGPGEGELVSGGGDGALRLWSHRSGGGELVREIKEAAKGGDLSSGHTFGKRGRAVHQIHESLSIRHLSAD